MHINKKAIDKRITETGIKKNYLALKTEVCRTTFYKYIGGKCDVPHRFVVLLAFALNISVKKIYKE